MLQIVESQLSGTKQNSDPRGIVQVYADPASLTFSGGTLVETRLSESKHVLKFLSWSVVVLIFAMAAVREALIRKYPWLYSLTWAVASVFHTFILAHYYNK